MNIILASSISKHAIEKLNESHDVICAFNAPEDKLASLVKDRDLIIFRSGVQISAKVMSAAPNLKFLIRAGSGLDNLDVGYSKQRGIDLVRIPEPGAKAVAELSFAFMLALSRNLLYADQEWKQGHWVKSELKSYLIRGKVLGIVGAGNLSSKKIYTSLKYIPEARLKAVCDLDENKARRNAEKFGAEHVFTDIDEMLEPSDLLDAVMICIGPEQHAQLAPKAAAERSSYPFTDRSADHPADGVVAGGDGDGCAYPGRDIEPHAEKTGKAGGGGARLR